MKINNITFLVFIIILISSCGNEIKNKDAKVEVENGTEIATSTPTTKPSEYTTSETSVPPTSQPTSSIEDQLLGFWVGNFVPANQKDDKTVYMGEIYSWNRTNKINIAIDQITDSLVIGHSVVAGNDRPFKGTMKKLQAPERFLFEVKEPGDNRYDGTFSFTISLDNNNLVGTWEAYKNIDIKKRKYSLSPKKFSYNPDIMLDFSRQYLDWNKVIKTKKEWNIDDEVHEWIEEEFSTATNLIYEINASNRLLTKSEVENLKKGDLTIIRNSIYARHGYSFKNRPLRVFFDSQEWYIPVHADIKKDFTEIEKENIKLLLRYEKNAAEYYDSFGRG